MFDLHAPAALEEMPIPVAFTLLCQKSLRIFRKMSPISYSPDKGAIDRASAVAEAIGLPFSISRKPRIDAHTIVHKAKDLQVRRKNRRHVDDMIATGGTIAKPLML